MPLGVEVGLGPGHIVLDGDPALTSQKGALPPPPPPPIFGPMFVVAQRLDESRCHLVRR